MALVSLDITPYVDHLGVGNSVATGAARKQQSSVERPAIDAQ
jgi:hypothetical protein